MIFIRIYMMIFKLFFNLFFYFFSGQNPPSGNLSDEVDRSWRVVGESPHDFATWEYLIQLQESQPDLSKIRAVLVEFLKFFPLCFGYWKKLADLEMAQSGKEKVIEVCGEKGFMHG